MRKTQKTYSELLLLHHAIIIISKIIQ